MKQFIHPQYLQLFYRHEKTDEIKSITIQWKDVIKFENESITQSIKTKDNMLIKIDIIDQLKLIAKHVTYDNESRTDLPLYQILPYKYELYEIDIVNKQNRHHIFGINENTNSFYQNRAFTDFEISFK